MAFRNPAEFGPSYWYVLHSMTAAYPTQPTVTDISLYGSQLLTFGYVLPCSACSPEYARLMETYGPLLYVLLCRGKLWVWLWGVLVHNEVNARLHKPVVPPGEVALVWGFDPAEAERGLQEILATFKVSRSLQSALSRNNKA